MVLCSCNSLPAVALGVSSCCCTWVAFDAALAGTDLGLLHISLRLVECSLDKVLGHVFRAVVRLH